MEKIKSYIDELIEKGGPDPHEYEKINKMISMVKQEEIQEFRNILKPVLNKETLQGWAFTKPFGYSGDHIMIDKIYNEHINNIKKYRKWDLYFHSHSAPRAVRNRKQYLINLLNNMDSSKTNNILILGSGPATDIGEFFSKYPGYQFYFDLVEFCNHAVQYSSKKLDKYKKNINFINTNIMRLELKKKYDLIWSAGLFDYVKDKHFIKFLKKFYDNLKTGGNVIIGNFSYNNTSRHYMEKVGNWYLKYRTKKELISLALKAGIEEKNIEINCEDLGVNLFMHLKK